MGSEGQVNIGDMKLPSTPTTSQGNQHAKRLHRADAWQHQPIVLLLIKSLSFSLHHSFPLYDVPHTLHLIVCVVVFFITTTFMKPVPWYRKDVSKLSASQRRVGTKSLQLEYRPRDQAEAKRRATHDGGLSWWFHHNQTKQTARWLTHVVAFVLLSADIYAV